MEADNYQRARKVRDKREFTLRVNKSPLVSNTTSEAIPKMTYSYRHHGNLNRGVILQDATQSAPAAHLSYRQNVSHSPQVGARTPLCQNTRFAIDMRCSLYSSLTSKLNVYLNLFSTKRKTGNPPKYRRDLGIYMWEIYLAPGSPGGAIRRRHRGRFYCFCYLRVDFAT
jgi:hypothetical protein